MLRFTRHGFREMLIGTVVLVVVAGALGWVLWPLALVVLPVLIWLFAFFRDPERAIPAGPGLIVSPGDGKVTETASMETPAGPRQRISIFLSVFNVHVNRSPIAGVIGSVVYKRGQYLNALNPASADQNEQNVVTVRGEDGTEVTFKQIAGLLARRIVFHLREGDAVARGERVGLIKFGSRVDVILPSEAVLSVKVGDKVKGGATVLAAMPTGERA